MAWIPFNAHLNNVIFTLMKSFQLYDVIHYDAKKKLPSYEVIKPQYAVLLY